MSTPTRAALVDDTGAVTNVIVLDPAGKWTPPAGLTIRELPADSPVAPGWTQDGATYAPPPALGVDRTTIPADGTTPAVVTYRNTRPDAPASVTFTANGATQAVQLAGGEARLEVVSSTPGDTVTVTVDALPGAAVTITVTGV